MGTLAILVLSGCATGTRQTSPLWDDSSRIARGPDQDRVNIWPLLYWQDPSLSIIWPLYTRTDQGHALVPAYEYTHDDRRLRIGTLHPDFVPVVADFDGGSDRWRVLNVVHDRKEMRRVVYPVYFRNYRHNNQSTLLFPVYYRDSKGYWTPLVTHRGGTTGILGPLFFRSEYGSRVTWAFPWPLVSVTPGETRGNVRVFPLYSHKWRPNRERRHAGLIVYRHSRNQRGERSAVLWPIIRRWDLNNGAEGSHFFPFYYHSSEDKKTTTNYLGFGYHRLETEDKTITHYLFPLGMTTSSESESTQHLIPFYLKRQHHETGVNAFYSPLVSWHDDGTLRNIGIILHHVQEQDGRRTASVLWPLIRWWSGPDGEQGSSVLPFYHRDVGSDRRLLATPLGGYHKNPEFDFRTVLGPVYFSHTQYKSDYNYTSYAWPLWHRGRVRETDWQALLPLYYTQGNEKESLLVTPLYTRRAGEEALSQSLLLGTVGWGHDPALQRRHHRVLPAYAWSNDESGMNFFALAGLIASSRDTAKNGRTHQVLPFYASKRDNNSRSLSVMLSMLLDSHESLQSRKEIEQEIVNSLPSPVPSANPAQPPAPRGSTTRRIKRPLREKNWIFTWLRQSTHLVAHAEWIANGTITDGEAGAMEKEPEAMWKVEFEEHERTLWWPIYHRAKEGDREARREILWRLYDSRKQTAGDDRTYARRRVLWRLWHQEQHDSHVSTDFFPFVSTDRNRDNDLFRWSFAGGLLGVQREGDKRRYRVLYFTL